MDGLGITEIELLQDIEEHLFTIKVLVCAVGGFLVGGILAK